MMGASYLCEYIKLRQYFINLAQHQNSDRPLPSERALAEMFGVARKTVRRALEDMVHDRYLIKQPRRGYFVNPLSFREDERKLKTIGLLHRSGMHALYNNEDTWFMETFFREIRKYNASAQLVMTSNQEEIYNDIVNSHVDGLVWIGIPERRRQTFERVAMGNEVPIVGYFDFCPPECGDYIYMDHFHEGYQKTACLLERGCRNILFVDAPVPRSRDGYLAALKEAGIPAKQELLATPDSCREQLAELLKRDAADGAVVCFNQADQVREVVLRHGLRIPHDFQLITGCTQYDWNPTMAVKPFDTIISRMLEQLWNRMQGISSELHEESLHWNIIQGTSTKNKEKNG